MSEPPCLGDGNEDKVVNGLDIESWRFFEQLTDKGSSWSDFNLDGYTNSADLKIIRDNLGKNCLKKKMTTFIPPPRNVQFWDVSVIALIESNFHW
jgi:hypothetical protein